MTPPPITDLVRANLSWGRDRAVTIGELAERMGFARRAIEQAVEALRVQGAPICTGPDGVWLTQDGEELLDQYRRLRARYIHQAVNARVLLRTAARFDKVQQMEMFG